VEFTRGAAHEHARRWPQIQNDTHVKVAPRFDGDRAFGADNAAPFNIKSQIVLANN